MKKPQFVTFTGVDDWTCVHGMFALSDKYPIEWGMLLSPKRQGVDPRFPGGEAQSRILCSGLRLAAHLCGDFSRSVMEGREIPPLSMPVDLGCFKRIQVNHANPVPEIIGKYVKGWGKIRGIAQTRTGFPRNTSVDWLYDPSGGKGERPKVWPIRGCETQFVGYAGGITPDNVLEILRAIDVEGDARGPFWIDMESGIRTDNRLDLDKCRRVCEAVFD